MRPDAFSKYSPLCWEFAQNVKHGYDPEKAIAYLVDELRTRMPKGEPDSAEGLYRTRNILDVKYVITDDFDGKLEPLGKGYEAGFQMYLNQKLPSTRLRFTALHELMHTFFYEYLPTKKYRNHSTDEGEERLCNWGAAHFLMPSKDLKKQIKAKPICIETTKVLCDRYNVSMPALIMRLRHLKLWNVQLSTWAQLSNGKMVLEENIGGLGNGWSWMNDVEIEDAFRNYRSKSGRTYLVRLTNNGNREVRPIRYDLIRTGRYMHVLSGPKVTGSDRGLPLLFPA
jgi:Zn-dependent peptidase ImmA (M78 family)